MTDAITSCGHHVDNACWDRRGDAVFVQQVGFFSLRRVPIDGSAPTELTQGVMSQWYVSPTDPDVVGWTTQDNQAFVRRTDAEGPTRVAAALGSGRFEWTPDGSALVGADPQTGELFVARVDGRGRWNLRVT